MSLHRVLGTAGHIDHGKTSLVKALTGIDTDRLKEEKERGITIELGFAHLALPGGDVVGVVDVPGHERFIRTMVAGAVGVDAVLLVVAADEGVMPQTREHLDILELLGVRRGVVALSKSDLVPPELLELAREELVSTLATSALRGSEIIACSARTGEGLPELCRAIERALRDSPGRPDANLVRLPVDRVFSLKGFGTVATGTLWSGRLRIGDELWPQPGQKNQVPAKVRGLHVHGQPVSEAVAGQRTAVNLPVPLAALQRGETLVRPDEIAAEQVGVLLDVELRYLEVARAPLERRSRLLLSAGTAQRLAQVTLLDRERALPGETALAQIQLDQPLCAVPGDRFVLRGFAPQKNHGTTVGGGRILRVLGGRHRRGSPRLLAALGRVAGALDALHPLDALAAAPTALAELVRAEAERRGLGGVTGPGLRLAVPVPAAQLEAALQALLRDGELVSVPPALYAPSVLRHVEEAVLAALARHRRELAVAALPPALGRLGGDRVGVGEGPAIVCPPRLASAALERLAERGLVRIERERVLLPEVGAPASSPAAGPAVAVDRDQALREGVLAVFRAAGLAPPRLDELPPLLQASGAPAAAALRGIVDGLCRTGALVRIKDLLFYKPHVDELRARLVQFLTAHREISPTQFKDLVGQSRKYTIPLAEHFDAEKVTLRVGDLRRLRTPAR
ncbi:MAG: selenocysteine-specific translation elongation factor [Polyangia bacterium]